MSMLAVMFLAHEALYVKSREPYWPKVEVVKIDSSLEIGYIQPISNAVKTDAGWHLVFWGGLINASTSEEIGRLPLDGHVLTIDIDVSEDEITRSGKQDTSLTSRWSSLLGTEHDVESGSQSFNVRVSAVGATSDQVVLRGRPDEYGSDNSHTFVAKWNGNELFDVKLVEDLGMDEFRFVGWDRIMRVPLTGYDLMAFHDSTYDRTFAFYQAHLVPHAASVHLKGLREARQWLRDYLVLRNSVAIIGDELFVVGTGHGRAGKNYWTTFSLGCFSASGFRQLDLRDDIVAVTTTDSGYLLMVPRDEEFRDFLRSVRAEAAEKD
jgi:hypothetical protein